MTKAIPCVPLCVCVCKRGHNTVDREGCFLIWNIGWAHDNLWINLAWKREDFGSQWRENKSSFPTGSAELRGEKWQEEI